MFPHFRLPGTTGAANQSTWNTGDREVRNRKALGRFAFLAFGAVVFFFGVRGLFSLWSSPAQSAECPSRSIWMANPGFVCSQARPTPNRFFEPFAPFRVLHLDCGAPPPPDMSGIRKLCCASTRVVFERLAESYLLMENGTAVRLKPGTMVTIFSQARDLICEPGVCHQECS
jgi:hypothetical protein